MRWFTSAAFLEIQKNLFKYLKTVKSAIQDIFPAMPFVVHNLSFLKPEIRNPKMLLAVT